MVASGPYCLMGHTMNKLCGVVLSRLVHVAQRSKETNTPVCVKDQAYILHTQQFIITDVARYAFAQRDDQFETFIKLQ